MDRKLEITKPPAHWNGLYFSDKLHLHHYQQWSTFDSSLTDTARLAIWDWVEYDDELHSNKLEAFDRLFPNCNEATDTQADPMSVNEPNNRLSKVCKYFALLLLRQGDYCYSSALIEFRAASCVVWLSLLRCDPGRTDALVTREDIFTTPLFQSRPQSPYMWVSAKCLVALDSAPSEAIKRTTN